jgi:hypothetical protein
MLNKKITIAAISTIIAFGIGLSISQSIAIQEKYSKVFYFDATFYEDKKYVEIIFTDETKKSTNTVLEILGLEESFQKTFDGWTFKTIVPFDGEPQYGWQTVPVTLVVAHPEFGKVGIKTEIHTEGKEGKVIFSQL